MCQPRATASVVEDAQKRMNEAVRKAITDALIELNIGNIMERLDKLISTLTEKVTELETFVAGNNDVFGSNTNGLLLEDTVHDVTGNMDRAAFRQARLRRRLHRNTTGMGGVHHCKVIITVCPMILMLRLSSQYHLFGSL